TRFSRDWSSDVCSSDLTMLCEAARHLDVRQPPAVLQLRGCQGLEGTLRIAHPMNRAAKPQLARGGDQELFQLCRALAIPPIADPDKIVFLPFFGQWLEESHVSRFVPGEDPATPAMLAIEVRKNLRSEEHTSELQSRENLVCRLLLEKKNTSQPY